MLLADVPEATIANSFWSLDTTALSVLLKRLEDSDKSTKAILNYFEKRAKIEQEYGNQLLELSESLLEIEDCFQIVSQSTEMSARAHIELGQQMTNMLQLPLKNYINNSQDIKSFMANQMKDSEDIKTSLGEQVKRARRRYVNEHQKPNPNDEQIDKLDSEYRKAVATMRSSSGQWIHDWSESCKTFQSLELDRLDHLKSVIKTFSSILTSTISTDDQTCERLSITMEDVDSSHEIMAFIQHYKTGSTVPELPKYTKYRPLEDTDFYTNQANNKKTILIPTSSTRRIKEINIPIQNNEELRSVSDQLRKLPSPTDSNRNNIMKLQKKQEEKEEECHSPHPYPLNPVYKLDRKYPSKSEPILNNTDWYLENNACPSSLAITKEQLEKQDSPASPIKKSSILLSFLKKKKKSVVQENHPRNKKRLSLGHITQYSQKRASSILTPPSPMFSPTDFYYSTTDQ